VKDGVFFAGEGVVAGADAVKITVDVEGGSPRRAFEHHVLKEVRHAALGDRLVARAGADEEADGDRARRRTGFTDDGQSILKRVVMELHAKSSKNYLGTSSAFSPSVTIAKFLGGYRSRCCTIICGVRASMAAWISSKLRTRPR